MKCPVCKGMGKVLSEGPTSHWFKCRECKGKKTVKRFIVDSVVDYNSIEMYLAQEPHPKYRLVSVVYEIKYQTYTLYWERKEEK
jgi:hypothetical protein